VVKCNGMPEPFVPSADGAASVPIAAGKGFLFGGKGCRKLFFAGATAGGPSSSIGACQLGPNIARLSFGATAGASPYKRLCRKYLF
jgi:hypothetical protein